MAESAGVRGLDDIWYDIEGPASPQVVAPLPASWSAGRRTRSSGSGPGSEGHRTGRELVRSCGSITARRFETLLRVERAFHVDDDHGYLIGPACQILESEFERRLASPARAIAGRLADALRRKEARSGQAVILEKWAAREVPTTIGVVSVILLSLRRGLEQDAEDIRQFLGECYRPRFSELLSTKELGRTFDLIREQYRNPACHGTRVFDAPAYAAFVRLMVASERFGTWADRGPIPPGPGPESGVLHHQIATSRLLDAPAPAVDPAAATGRLLSLATPSDSPFAVEVNARHLGHPAGGRTMRDLVAGKGGSPARFRVGDPVRIDVASDRDGHLALIDVGTSGGVSVALPNAWRGEVRVGPGRPRSFPDAADPECDLTLGGPPGREHLVAIVTSEPLPIPLHPVEPAAFRSIGPPEVDALVDVLGRLDERTWAVARCAIEVEPG